jgi:hypothetical protein
VAIAAHGRPATGIPAIKCPSWCKDPGHIGEHHTEDQNCYSGDVETNVKCSLSVEAIPRFGACYSVVGAFAYRGFNSLPVVQLYVSGFDPNIDRTFDLTADEARHPTARSRSSLGPPVHLVGGREDRRSKFAGPLRCSGICAGKSRR